MKAEPLLKLWKNCVLCLFLLVSVTCMNAQVRDTSVILSSTVIQNDRESKMSTFAGVDSAVSTEDTSHAFSVEDDSSFWDDTLQPILVTAGAAAVIALFFFVKF